CGFSFARAITTFNRDEVHSITAKIIKLFL
ncbi:MAG: hypothetical protein ACI8T6_000923, partial [Candidatus Poseidoniaceae archaeon]